MIFDLPPPYEDELLHNTCLRYAMRVMPSAPDRVLRELFGGLLPLSVFYPPSLENFTAAGMPHLVPIIGRVVERHTFVPYVAAFQGRTWASDKHSEAGSYDYERIVPLLREVQFPPYLRWCPQCAREDRVLYGEAYWRRAHQVPGCWVCMKHRLRLVDSADPGRAWIAYRPAELSIPRDVDAYVKEATFRSRHSRTLHRRLLSLLETPYCVPDPGDPRIGTLRLHIFGSRYFPSSAEITEAFHDMWGEAIEQGVGREVLGANTTRRFPDMKSGCRKPYLRMMLEIFFAETYGVDLHDSIYAEPVGPPRIGLRFRCVSPIARHGPDHWVSKYQRCRNDKAFVNVNCKCGFSFKVHRSLSRCEITRADIVRINRYGEGYRAYIRQRINDSASISQIAKELGIGKGVVIQLSRSKPLSVMQRYAKVVPLPSSSTSRTSPR